MSKLHLGISLLPRKEREQSKPLGSECFMNSLIFIGIIRKSTKMFETRRNQAHFSENLTHQARIVCLSGHLSELWDSQMDVCFELVTKEATWA
jgi:hypothetical protein